MTTEKTVILYTDKNRVAFRVDASDVQMVSCMSWHIDSRGYPTTDAGKRPNLMRLTIEEAIMAREAAM